MLLNFPERLATVIYQDRTLWVVRDLRMDRGPGEGEVQGPAWKLYGTAGIEVKEFTLTEITQIAPNYWEGVSWPNSVPMVIRPTVETDSLQSLTFEDIDIPLPVGVIDSLLEPVHVTPLLYAMSEDDGYVVTMMLTSDAGLYMRYSGAWHDLVPDVIDGLNTTEVSGSALDMFDQFDRAGQLAHVGSMPRVETEVDRATPLDEMPDERAVVASMAVPRLASIDDFEGAVQAAVSDPDLRWYVERRCAALGIDSALPWQEA